MKAYSKHRPQGITIDPNLVSHLIGDAPTWIGPCPCCSNPIVIKCDDAAQLSEIEKGYINAPKL
jgi:hypothetical protein